MRAGVGVTLASACLLVIAACGGRAETETPTGFVVVEVTASGERFWLERWPLAAITTAQRPVWRSPPYEESAWPNPGDPSLVVRRGDELAEVQLDDGAERVLGRVGRGSRTVVSPDRRLRTTGDAAGCQPLVRSRPIRVVEVAEPGRLVAETPSLRSGNYLGGAWALALAPDSSRLAYGVERWEAECRGHGAVYDLFVLELRTGTARQLEDGTFFGYLAFAPDSTKVAYVTLGGTVRLVDLGRFSVTELPDDQLFDGDYPSRVAWSPDSSKLIVSQHGSVSAYDVATGTRDRPEKVSTAQDSVVEILGASPDGRLIAFGLPFGRGPIMVNDLTGQRAWTFPIPSTGARIRVDRALVVFD